jgi:hypothetical protein
LVDPHPEHKPSFFLEQKINDPASSHMLARLTAMIQNVSVGAARFFKSIRQYRHTVKGTLIVDGLGDPLHRAIVPHEPGGVERHGTEGVAENTAKKLAFVVPPPNVCRHTDYSIRHATSSLVGILGGDPLGSIGCLGHYISGSQGIEVRRRSRYVNKNQSNNTEGSLGILTSQTYCPFVTPALRKVLGHLDSTTTALVTNFAPNPATTRNAKKSQFALAGSASQEG